LEREEIVEHLSEMHETSRGWLANLIETMPHTDLIWVLVIMWAIWYARRKAIYKNIFQSPLSTHSFINKYIAELQAAKPNQAVKPQACGGARASARAGTSGASIRALAVPDLEAPVVTA
jgi:hypothetical protein